MAGIATAKQPDMNGFETVLGVKLSAFFGGSGLFLSAISIFLGFIEGEAIPASAGSIGGLLFIISGIYFRNLEFRLKEREDARKQQKHNKYLEIIQKVQDEKMDENRAEFFLKHLDETPLQTN
jgi:hypothetical protein